MISSKNQTGGMQAGRGFSLIEVLIALIILSVGMLGIAGLYVQSMQAGRTSMFRHNAVTLAGDIADRIRANPAGGTAYTAATGADNSCVNGGIDCSPGRNGGARYRSVAGAGRRFIAERQGNRDGRHQQSTQLPDLGWLG